MRLSRSLASIATASVLFGCQSPPKENPQGPAEDLGQTEDFATVCPGNSLVPGIDVSVYQGNIDWTKVAASGQKFAITRLNDGTVSDSKFQQNWDGIKAAGMIRGVYQFFEPTDDVPQQAQLVIDAVGKLGAGDLPAMIDVEKVSSSTSPAKYASEVQQWLDLVEAGTGKKPMIYTGKYFWQDNVGSDAFKDYPLIHAGYPNACQPPNPPPPMCTSCPNLADQFDDWQFWQYSSSGDVPGISNAVDMDVFNGTEADLAALSAPTYAAEVVSIDVPPMVSAGSVFMAHVTYKNVGGVAWDSNTKIGTTEPRDRKSVFYDATTWPSLNRAAAVTAPVMPGAEMTFDVSLRAPDMLGSYTESFGLVEEGVTWFSDDGGPADDAVSLQLQVVSPSMTTSTSTTSGSGGGGGSGGDGASADMKSGCSCSVGDDDAAPPLGWLGAAACAFFGIRRRRLGRPASAHWRNS